MGIEPPNRSWRTPYLFATANLYSDHPPSAQIFDLLIRHVQELENMVLRRAHDAIYLNVAVVTTYSRTSDVDTAKQPVYQQKHRNMFTIYLVYFLPIIELDHQQRF